jgi:hypothetical protein
VKPGDWDGLSPVARAERLRSADRSLRDKRWAPLVSDMSSRRFEELTPVQRMAVEELS